MIKQDGSADIISYSRSDVEGPKLSDYEKSFVNAENVENLMKVLTRSLGILGVVKKTRHLYMVGQTRIHLDSVERLGNFVELEVVLKDAQTVEEGTLIAEDLMDKLGVAKDDLIPVAYMDMLLCSKTH